MGVDLLRDELLRVRALTPQAEYDALQEWVEEAVRSGHELPIPTETARPQGVCATCEERAATAVCVHCGRSVCAAHHWVMYGLCRACLTPEELREARERVQRRRPDLGIKWIQD